METKEAKQGMEWITSYERQGIEKGKVDIAKRMVAK